VIAVDFDAQEKVSLQDEVMKDVVLEAAK